MIKYNNEQEGQILATMDKIGTKFERTLSKLYRAGDKWQRLKIEVNFFEYFEKYFNVGYCKCKGVRDIDKLHDVYICRKCKEITKNTG